MHQGTYKSKVFVTYMTIVHCSFYLSLALLFIIPSLVCCPCLILVWSAKHVPNECEYELWKYFNIIIIVVDVVVVVVDIIIKIPLWERWSSPLLRCISSLYSLQNQVPNAQLRDHCSKPARLLTPNKCPCSNIMLFSPLVNILWDRNMHMNARVGCLTFTNKLLCLH